MMSRDFISIDYYLRYDTFTIAVTILLHLIFYLILIQVVFHVSIFIHTRNEANESNIIYY